MPIIIFQDIENGNLEDKITELNEKIKEDDEKYQKITREVQKRGRKLVDLGEWTRSREREFWDELKEPSIGIPKLSGSFSGARTITKKRNEKVKKVVSSGIVKAKRKNGTG